MNLFILSLWIILASLDTAAGDCNPLTQNACDPIPGLASSSYNIDFTNQRSLPSDWILADGSNVTFSDKGAQFNFNKRKDAPYIWTNFYVAYGKIDVELQVAEGTGVITSAVMFSDDADEIDWEFSGSNFGAGASSGKAQTNVFAKGITGSYDRGTQQDLTPPPQTSFHTYTINWTPDRIDWIIDGATKYSTTNNAQNVGNYQFPQTPSRLHIGIWDAGDPDTAAGTRNWAGGYTDYTQVPYVAFVKSVKISTPYPCKSWQYPAGFSGSWKDVKCTNQTVTTTGSATKTSSAIQSTYTASIYTVVVGDNGWGIADKIGCTFDQLSAANPGVNWDALLPGQTLKNPNAVGTATGASTASTSSTQSFKSSNSINTSNSGTESRTGSSSSAANTIIPVGASDLGSASSVKPSVGGMTGSSSISGNSSNISSTPTPPIITEGPLQSLTVSTSTKLVSDRRSTGGRSTAVTTASTTTQSPAASAASSSNADTSIETASSSSGSGWSTWAGNYAGVRDTGRQNTDKGTWAFWRRLDDKNQKSKNTYNLQHGRVGYGHQHA